MNLKNAVKVFEKQFIEERLKQHRYNQTKTALSLNIHRNHLSNKMKELGIKKKRDK